MATYPVVQKKLTIESRLEVIADARRWAAQYAKEAGFAKDDVFSIELAVGEALTNIIRHAYKDQPGHKIHLSLTIDKIEFRLRIRDFGQKFDPTHHPPPNLDVPHEGGYGIYLIKEVMDKATYNTSLSEGTELELIKYHSAEESY